MSNPNVSGGDSLAEVAAPGAIDSSPFPRTLRDLDGPRGLPLLGNLLQLTPSRLHRVFEAWAERFGPFFTFRLGRQRCLAVSDLVSIQRVLRDRPHNYRRLSPIESVFRELGGHGMFSAEGDSWRAQRRLVMPAFTMKQQRALYAALAMFTERLCESLSTAAATGDAIEIRDELARYTVDVTSSMAFGHDLDTIRNPASELQAHMKRLFVTANRRVGAAFPYWRYFKLPSDRAANRSLAVVHGVLARRITAARAALHQGGDGTGHNMLDAMLMSQLADAGAGAQRVSDEVLAGNAFTLLLAGEDTTASTMAWMLFHLAHDPELQARARQEADEVLGEARVLPSYDDAGKLRIIAAVAQEALRVRSAAPLLFLETLTHQLLSDIELPAGTPVFLLTRKAAMSEDAFSDPARFDPGRWLADASAAPSRHDPHAMLAFGAGPRACPGRSLALLECALVTSMVLRNFELRPVGTREEVQERYDFTMHPVGLRVQLVPR